MMKSALPPDVLDILRVGRVSALNGAGLLIKEGWHFNYFFRGDCYMPAAIDSWLVEHRLGSLPWRGGAKNGAG